MTQLSTSIAAKLEQLIDSVSEDILEEKERNFFLQAIVSVSRNLDEMIFTDYKITVDIEYINDKPKRLYSIIDLDTNEVIYSKLILLISAIKIIELLQVKRSQTKADHIANLDRSYQIMITDAYVNEIRKSQTKSLVQNSIYSAKASGSLAKAKYTRQMIEMI
jgi:hypothetical protein